MSLFPRLLPTVRSRLVRRMAEGIGGHEEETKEEKSPMFGQRYLRDPQQVFQHNSWDSVKWSEDQLTKAEESIKANSSQKLTTEQQKLLRENASEHWNEFYGRHQNKFFKDRQWLPREFPELLGQEDVPQSVLEVGCGVGNTVFPILQTTQNTFVHCCDFSSTAIELVKSNPLYDPSRCSAFIHDLASDDPLPLPPNSIDHISLIYVLTALPPERFHIALSKLVRVLKPGGKVLFRDYGRLDLAQLRFKPGQCLGDDHYVRGDGTLVYFFTEGEVAQLMEGVGLEKELLHVDQHLQVNRGKQLTMHRVWIFAKYQKPHLTGVNNKREDKCL